MRLDSTICRFRKDYEVIHNEHADEESDSDEVKEEEESDPEDLQFDHHAVQDDIMDPLPQSYIEEEYKARPYQSSGLDKLLRTGRSGSDQESENESSDPSIEKLEDEDDID